jgi:hypothetical protein
MPSAASYGNIRQSWSNEDKMLVHKPGRGTQQDPALHAASSHDEMTAGLPPPVADYIRATNLSDLDALLETFVDDALVNDQLRDYWGKEAIADWAARDIIGERLTLKVVNTVQHYGHSIVTAYVDGLFDKRGLPDPLELAFYFSSQDDKIVQLIILRNHSGI